MLLANCPIQWCDPLHTQIFFKYFLSVWLSEHVDVLPEDRVRIDPDLWGRMVGFVERRETIHATYVKHRYRAI